MPTVQEKTYIQPQGKANKKKQFEAESYTAFAYYENQQLLNPPKTYTLKFQLTKSPGYLL
jgi:hypothetical protein